MSLINMEPLEAGLCQVEVGVAHLMKVVNLANCDMFGHLGVVLLCPYRLSFGICKENQWNIKRFKAF